MERPVNPGCAGCDYAPGCRKRWKLEGAELLAKEQDVYRMTCVCIVQDVCRDCLLFANKRCASWQVFNGKPSGQRLARCPKKITVS